MNHKIGDLELYCYVSLPSLFMVSEKYIFLVAGKSFTINEAVAT